MEGIYAIYKPSGMTSHDVIYRLRRLTGVKRIGHAGTLDPLARGVLVVGIGKTYTRLLHTIMKTEKEYIVEAHLGEFSETDDAEGKKITGSFQVKPSKEDTLQALEKFQGDIMLAPPVYSAIKVKGRRAYALAREGKDVQLEKRPSHINAVEWLSYDWPKLRFRVVTGSGVYVRSIVRKLGEDLACGAYVADLERTRVGDYSAEEAKRIEDLLF